MTDMLTRPGLPALAYEFRAGAGPTIVFLPGFASNMQGSKAIALDAWAAREGRAMLRFDYAGCGESEGDFEEGTLSGWRDDALHLIDSLVEGPVILVGSSMGGWIMLLIALARPDRVAGLVGVAAAPDFTDWGFDDTIRAQIEADGLIARESPYDDSVTVITLPFWQSGQDNCLLGGPIAVDCPVRLLHGMEDADVPPSIAFRLGRAVRSADVQTILVKQGDHRLSRPQDLGLLLTTVNALIEGL